MTKVINIAADGNIISDLSQVKLSEEGNKELFEVLKGVKRNGNMESDKRIRRII